MSVRTDAGTGVRPRPPRVREPDPDEQGLRERGTGRRAAGAKGARGQAPAGQRVRTPAGSPSPVPPGRPRPVRRRAAGPGPGRSAGPGQRGPAGTSPDQATGTGPVRAPGTVSRTGPWAGAPAAGIARTPFIVFVTALLGGGLICLLVINTILATGSYQITSLQQAQAARAQQVQVLKQQVAQESAPSVIAKRARQLGMVEPPLTKFLNLKSGRIIRQPATEPGVPAVPGYTP